MLRLRLQLLNQHPAMKGVVIDEVKRLLFRSSTPERTMYVRHPVGSHIPVLPESRMRASARTASSQQMPPDAASRTGHVCLLCRHSRAAHGCPRAQAKPWVCAVDRHARAGSSACADGQR